MTDAELVARLKANDDDAYREVVARYGDALYSYIYGITGDHHLSEDVISETYLRMVERIDGYTFYGAPFKAWLYRIAHNLAINALKRRRFTVPVTDMASAEPAGDDPAATVGARMEAEELRAAIAGLTEDQQQVVLLRFVGGHSHLEVARALEKTETAVKQLQLRALRSLGRMLQRG
ncbi:MAG TPA: sigma-70 family RNA polymerase sigma factor [Roseiflexaceae bacterium]|nr:sigma-70 family RNA polymerase sigma factor [Roseiflexaceae bacterium]